MALVVEEEGVKKSVSVFCEIRLQSIGGVSIGVDRKRNTRGRFLKEKV